MKITVSIGTTQWYGELDDINSMIVRADQAIYEAKNNGRNKVVQKQKR